MTKDEALKLALEALEIVNREMLTLRDELAERGGRPSQGYHQLLWDSSHKVYTDTAIPAAEAIREALAQPEQEPVAWICEGSSPDEKHAIDYWPWDVDDLPIGTQLYTSPPPQRTWVGLTEKEKASFWTADQMTQEEWDELFTDIETKLKEKNA